MIELIILGDVRVVQEIRGLAHLVGYQYSSAKNFPTDVYASILKRWLDWSFASVALLCLSPLLVVCAALIMAESPGPPIYRQKRMGKDGRAFWIYKLRTMYFGTESLSCKTLDGDPRITSLGRFLRVAKIDELPQLWNVICGDMSVIGPRPLSVDEINSLIEQGYPASCPGLMPTTNPGLIGLEQVSRTRSLTYRERFDLNTLYEQSLSWQLDLRIFQKALVQCQFVTNMTVLLAVLEISLVVATICS